TPVTATVLDADTRSPSKLEDEMARLGSRARSGELTPPEQAGATFTFEDLAEQGIHRAAGLVRPSQAAILTAGAIRAVPVVRDGTVVPGHQLTLTLAADHRIVFGALAAGFLRRVTELVEGGTRTPPMPPPSASRPAAARSCRRGCARPSWARPAARRNR